jgi:hypothetical protein
MKMSVKEAVEILNKINTDSEIFIWFITREDMGCSKSKWKKVEDDSQGLEDTLNEYVSSWIQEV